MASRTAQLLDDETHAAAKEIAVRYECSMSEAIRRAVLSHRDALPDAARPGPAERARLLHRLFELFEGHDAEAEIRRLKGQDEAF